MMGRCCFRLPSIGTWACCTGSGKLLPRRVVFEGTVVGLIVAAMQYRTSNISSGNLGPTGWHRLVNGGFGITCDEIDHSFRGRPEKTRALRSEREYNKAERVTNMPSGHSYRRARSYPRRIGLETPRTFYHVATYQR